MKVAIVALAAIAAVVAASKSNDQEEIYTKSKEHAPTTYAFQYAVRDEYSYVDMGHKEHRKGEDTKGSYFVVLPDGRRQSVSYYVDGYSGYVANVHYSGEPKFDSQPAYEATYKAAPKTNYNAQSPAHSEPSYTTTHKPFVKADYRPAYKPQPTYVAAPKSNHKPIHQTVYKAAPQANYRDEYEPTYEKQPKVTYQSTNRPVQKPNDKAEGLVYPSPVYPTIIQQTGQAAYRPTYQVEPASSYKTAPKNTYNGEYEPIYEEQPETTYRSTYKAALKSSYDAEAVVHSESSHRTTTEQTVKAAPKFDYHTQAVPAYTAVPKSNYRVKGPAHSETSYPTTYKPRQKLNGKPANETHPSFKASSKYNHKAPKKTVTEPTIADDTEGRPILLAPTEPAHPATFKSNRKGKSKDLSEPVFRDEVAPIYKTISAAVTSEHATEELVTKYFQK